MVVNRSSEIFRNSNVERVLTYIIVIEEFDAQISVVCFFIVHVVPVSFICCCAFNYVVKDNSQNQPPEVFCKKGVLKNFANFTGKHLCWSLFLIKLQA